VHIGRGRSETTSSSSQVLSSADSLRNADVIVCNSVGANQALPVVSGSRGQYAPPAHMENQSNARPHGKPSVLFLGNYRPALTLARTFADMGYRVIVTLAPEGVAQFSRFVDECWHSPPLNEPLAFFEGLRDFLNARRDITVVYPVHELCLRHFPAHAHLLPTDRLYVKPDDTTLETCLDKSKMMTAAAEVGVLCARYIEVKDHAALLAAARLVGFPLIVKPSNSCIWIDGKKVVVARSLRELTEALPKWPAIHSELIVQAYVDGPRINFYFAAQNGVPIRYLTAEILKTDEEDGTGLAVEGYTTEFDPEISSIGDRLLRRLNYHGVGLIQVLRDRRSKKYYFLELNPRIAACEAVPEYCGLGLGALAMELAQGNAADSDLKIGTAGVQYIWATAMIDMTLKAAQSRRINLFTAIRRLAATMRSSALADLHLIWHRRDPLPALTEIARNVPVLRRIRKHVAKRLKRTAN